MFNSNTENVLLSMDGMQIENLKCYEIAFKPQRTRQIKTVRFMVTFAIKNHLYLSYRSTNSYKLVPIKQPLDIVTVPVSTTKCDVFHASRCWQNNQTPTTVLHLTYIIIFSFNCCNTAKMIIYKPFNHFFFLNIIRRKGSDN